MDIERKVFKFDIKELSDEGKFQGYLSVFDNVDAGGDLVERGAFKKTLKENKAFPLIWQHFPTSPDLIVGAFTGKEDEKGLLVDGEFFLDIDGAKKAYVVTKKLKEREIKMGLSMGYKTVKKSDDEIDGLPIRRLVEVRLHEGSLTLFPMNPQARIETIKAIDLEMKPYPNEHACRLHDPDKYERFVRMSRKHDGKEYSVIVGFKKGGGSEDQAYRYPKDTWSESEARSHCKDHNGSFEAAKKTINAVCSSCGETLEIELEPEASTQVKEPSQLKPEEIHLAVKRIAESFKKS